MKEATGELNSTVFIVLAVGVLMAFFYYTLWPIVRVNFEKNSQCGKAVCESCKNNCSTVVCYPKGHYGDSERAFECTYKG